MVFQLYSGKHSKISTQHKQNKNSDQTVQHTISHSGSAHIHHFQLKNSLNHETIQVLTMHINSVPFAYIIPADTLTVSSQKPSTSYTNSNRKSVMQQFLSRSILTQNLAANFPGNINNNIFSINTGQKTCFYIKLQPCILNSIITEIMLHIHTFNPENQCTQLCSTQNRNQQKNYSQQYSFTTQIHLENSLILKQATELTENFLFTDIQNFIK